MSEKSGGLENASGLRLDQPHALFDELKGWQVEHQAQMKKLLTGMFEEYQQRTVEAVEEAVKRSSGQLPSSARAYPVELFRGSIRSTVRDEPCDAEGAGSFTSLIALDKSDAGRVKKVASEPSNLRGQKVAFAQEGGDSDNSNPEGPTQEKKGKRQTLLESSWMYTNRVPIYSGTDSNLKRAATHIQIRTIKRVVQHRWFDYVIGAAIVLNSIFIAVQTDLAAKTNDETPPQWFHVFEIAFTFIFTVELLLRLVAESSDFVIGKNKAWNFLDTVIVTSSIIEVILSSVALNLTVIRVIRILRLVRLVRVLRVMRLFSDLRVMAAGILSSMSSLAWAILLLVAIMFVFGICVTQVVTAELAQGDSVLLTKLSQEQIDNLRWNFGSLLASMYALFKAVSGGIDWADCADPLIIVSPLTGFGFCFYITFAVFAVLNIITGVFVENAIKTKDHDSDLMVMEHAVERQKMIEQARKIFEKVDTGNRGCLDLEQFVCVCNDAHVTAYFNHLGIDLDGGLSAQGLFTLLDFDANGLVGIDEFIFGCARLKGLARSLDLARIVHVQRGQSEHMLMLGHDLEKVRELCDTLSQDMKNFKSVQRTVPSSQSQKWALRSNDTKSREASTEERSSQDKACLGTGSAAILPGCFVPDFETTDSHKVETECTV